MDEWYFDVLRKVIDFVEVALAEVSIFAFIIGLIFFVLGLLILVLSLYVKITGTRVKGKVLGAIKDEYIKEKNRNGKIEKEKKENYHAVYEYTRPDGTLRQEKSSNGGYNMLKYKTGQDVDLIITPYGEYDDVYDANDRSSFYMGLAFFIIGFGIIYWSANLYASLGVTTLAALTILVIFVVRVITGRKKKKKKEKSTVAKHPKEFDASEVKPVEFYREQVPHLKSK